MSSIGAKLSALAGLIETRQDSLEKVQDKNKWSVPLAIIGCILTAIFGIASVAIPIIFAISNK